MNWRRNIALVFLVSGLVLLAVLAMRNHQGIVQPKVYWQICVLQLVTGTACGLIDIWTWRRSR